MYYVRHNNGELPLPPPVFPFPLFFPVFHFAVFGGQEEKMFITKTLQNYSGLFYDLYYMLYIIIVIRCVVNSRFV